MIDVTIKLLSRSAAQEKFDIVQTETVQVDAEPIILAPEVPAECKDRELAVEITPRGGAVTFIIRGQTYGAWSDRPTLVPFFAGRRIGLASVGVALLDPDQVPVQVEAAAETAGS